MFKFIGGIIDSFNGSKAREQRANAVRARIAKQKASLPTKGYGVWDNELYYNGKPLKG